MRPGVDAFRAQPNTDRESRNGWARGPGGDGRNKRRPHHGSYYPAAGAIYFPGYAYGAFDPYPAPPATEATTPSIPTGFLRLLVTPRDAAVIVDGLYEGTVDDFGGTGERALASGLHHVRLETEGYEPVAFEVRIPDNDTITLRRDLSPRSTPPSPVAAPVRAPAQPPTTIYVIPRCYLGDSRPRQEQLPAGCSVADLRTLP